MSKIKSKTLPRNNKVFVERSGVLEEIIASSDNNITYSTRHEHTKIHEKKFHTAPVTISVDTPRTLLTKQRALQAIKTQELIEQNLQKHIESEIMKKERNFPILLSKVDQANEFLDTVEKEMRLIEETKRNKTRRQFNEWNMNVHGSIQVQIATIH
jgi:replicative superfamily II helicase